MKPVHILIDEEHRRGYGDGQRINEELDGWRCPWLSDVVTRNPSQPVLVLHRGDRFHRRFLFGEGRVELDHKTERSPRSESGIKVGDTLFPQKYAVEGW